MLALTCFPVVSTDGEKELALLFGSEGNNNCDLLHECCRGAIFHLCLYSPEKGCSHICKRMALRVCCVVVPIIVGQTKLLPHSLLRINSCYRLPFCLTYLICLLNLKQTYTRHKIISIRTQRLYNTECRDYVSAGLLQFSLLEEYII